MSTTIEELNNHYGHLREQELISAVINDYGQKAVLISAFNPEDVIISHWIANAASQIDILFLDTLKHFPDTLRYKDAISEQLGLTQLKVLHPDDRLLGNSDPEGELWKHQVNRCCWLRKVEPLERELKAGEYTLIFTGRRREQTPERAEMPLFEIDEENRIKVNPLFDWDKKKREEMMQAAHLAHHPLYELGYLSIGCAPCSTPIFAGEDERAGRWRHTRIVQTNDSDAGQKTECGLHVSLDNESEES